MSYIRVRLTGTLPGGEVWSVNPAFNETTNVVTWDQLAGNAAALAVARIDVPTPLSNIRGGAAPGTGVRIERRSDAHVLIGAAETAWTRGASGATTSGLPPQTAMVISLRSTTPGSKGRGRLYWPATGAGLNTSTLRLANPTPAAAASAAATYLDAIATALKEGLEPSPSLIDYDLCVVSPTTGTKTRITRVEVGDVLDVQRRRRDRLVEAYASAPMP
jgi:hypothetical protein